MAEWFKAAVLKTAEGNTSVSSNLTFSANIYRHLEQSECLYFYYLKHVDVDFATFVNHSSVDSYDIYRDVFALAVRESQ